MGVEGHVSLCWVFPPSRDSLTWGGGGWIPWAYADGEGLDLVANRKKKEEDHQSSLANILYAFVVINSINE